MPLSGDEPGRAEVYYAVIRSINNRDWKEFARSKDWLDLPRSVMDDIEHDYSVNISEQKYQMLNCWEQRKGRNATPQLLKQMAQRFLERERPTINQIDSRDIQQSLPQQIPQRNQQNPPAPFNRETFRFRQVLMKVSNKLTTENVTLLQHFFSLPDRSLTKANIIFHLEDNGYLGTISTADKLSQLRSCMSALDRDDLCRVIDEERHAFCPPDEVDAQTISNVTENDSANISEDAEEFQEQYEEEPVASLSSSPVEQLPFAESVVQDLTNTLRKEQADKSNSKPSAAPAQETATQALAPGTIHIGALTINVSGDASHMNLLGVQQTVPKQPVKVKDVDKVDIDVEDMCTYSSLDVTVTKTTKEFYASHKNNAETYSVTSKPKGNALIISNIDFPSWGSDSRRNGGEKDRLLMARLFGPDGLGLRLTVEENKTAERMWEILEKFSKDVRHATADMCVVIIMSHGGFAEGTGDYFYGSDGKYILAKDVIRLFDNDNCRNLQGKPKLFFFQFCRGKDADKGVKTNNDRHDFFPERSLPMPSPSEGARRLCPEQDATDGGDHLPRRSDILVAYATQQGDLSFRSWFTNAIVNVFSKKAHFKKLGDMLKEVKRGLSKKVSSTLNSSTHECKEMADIQDVLLRDVYFFPGHP